MSDSPKKTRPLKWLLGPLAIVLLAIVVVGGWWLNQRYVRLNFHPVVEGQVYRSAQPTPDSLRRWQKQYGLKTVLNLRGDQTRDIVVDEMAAAEELGLKYICIRLPNRQHPPKDDLLAVIDVLEAAERPLLFHCRSGADRSGVVGAIAAMAVGGKSYDEAVDHLSWAYLHMDNKPEHVAGIMQLYEDYCREHDIGTGGWRQFRTWLDEQYVGPQPPATPAQAEAPAPTSEQ